VNDEHDTDERLRTLFEPDRSTVDRLVATALKNADSRLHRRTKWMPLALAVAGTLAVAATLVWFNVRSPETSDWLTINPIGDLVLVQSSTGESWIMGPVRSDDQPPAGMGFVIVEGEMK